MELEDLFVSYKEVKPVSFKKEDIPNITSPYLNIDRAKKVLSDIDDKNVNNVDSNQNIQEEEPVNWIVRNADIVNDNIANDSIVNDKIVLSDSSDYFTRLKDFIKKEEGFRKKAYKDGKYYSIGYGFNGPQYKEGDVMTLLEAEEELTRQLSRREATYKKRFGNKWDKLTDNQKIALLSYGYNTGDGNVIGGDVAKYLDDWDLDKVKNSLRINTFKGQYNKGLDARRKRERELFMS